ncbi:zinc-binding dehydrogenase [Nesterenkonia muleiensis]|uniref:zinc-binding dehydrogenase n=1 Tax=Nesterenkonia muleiensis TaxID=2282648 RepID=UPI001EE4383E|nr:zinc-binding dehydrogenase [Nesterenkonia muleiensis]
MPLPPEVSVEEAAIISCAVTTGIGAVRNTAQVEAGTTVVVAGCGGVGQAIIMGLVQAGAEQIVVIDRSQAKLDLAMELGATKTALAFDSSQKVQALTTDRGFDYAFDAVGAPSVTEELSQLLGPGGKLVLVGMPAKGAHASFETWSLVGRGITILGSNYGSSVPHRDFVELAEARLSGALPLAKLVGERIQLSDAATAVQNLPKAEGPRSVVVFSQADGP